MREVEDELFGFKRGFEAAEMRELTRQEEEEEEEEEL